MKIIIAIVTSVTGSLLVSTATFAEEVNPEQITDETVCPNSSLPAQCLEGVQSRELRDWPPLPRIEEPECSESAGAKQIDSDDNYDSRQLNPANECLLITLPEAIRLDPDEKPEQSDQIPIFRIPIFHFRF